MQNEPFPMTYDEYRREVLRIRTALSRCLSACNEHVIEYQKRAIENAMEDLTRLAFDKPLPDKKAGFKHD